MAPFPSGPDQGPPRQPRRTTVPPGDDNLVPGIGRRSTWCPGRRYPQLFICHEGNSSLPVAGCTQGIVQAGDKPRIARGCGGQNPPRPVEAAVFDPPNPHVLGPTPAVAMAIRLTPDERELFGPGLLVEQGYPPPSARSRTLDDSRLEGSSGLELRALQALGGWCFGSLSGSVRAVRLAPLAHSLTGVMWLDFFRELRKLPVTQ